ncbi:MAG: MarR family transcriptional regulator, partial [Acidobacteria bacterium]|nr:MarR family transcriptional regulator [Acidobacteriota bacterium]
MRAGATDRRGLSKAVSQAEYQALAEFRYELASFLRRRRRAAQNAGIEPQQYELMLAIKGLPEGKKPSIKQVAEQLRLQHHSAVELTTRLVDRGLVRRERSLEDRRSILLSLTKEGERALDEVVCYSLTQLREEGPELLRSLARLVK